MIFSLLFIAWHNPERMDEAYFPINSCGAAALVICLNQVDPESNFSISDFHRAMGSKGDQTSLLDLKQLAEELGYGALGIKSRTHSSESFSEIPAILPVSTRDRKTHFIAAVGSRPEELLIVDFPGMPRWVPISHLKEKLFWDGTMLLVGEREEISNKGWQLRGSQILFWALSLGLAYVSLQLIRRLLLARPKSQPA